MAGFDEQPAQREHWCVSARDDSHGSAGVGANQLGADRERFWCGL